MRSIPTKLLFSLLLLPAFAGAQTKTFGQADLERLVGELDKAIPHNENYAYPIRCTLEAADEVNAYATYTEEGTTKRATMVVFTGLVKAANGDERLVRACIAHELSHLSRGHSLGPRPAARDLANLWTRQKEYEADKYGAEALAKTGHPKKDMIDLLLLLDGVQGRDGVWLGKLTADHADPKARAAELADDPKALQALVLFDTGLAYEDARQHLYAQKLFEASADLWPALTDAHTNAAKCALMFYYDNLPAAVRASWWRPDFGPLITNPHAPLPQAVAVTDQDREAWRDALAAAKKAVEKSPTSEEAQEILALAQVLEPDAKKDAVAMGVGWFKAHAEAAKEPTTKLRYANNAGVGLQRTDDLDGAYGSIMLAQKGTDVFNPALGENLGLVVVKGRSKDDDALAAAVLLTWLSNTPSSSPRWNTVKKTFDDIVAANSFATKPIAQQPAYLCRVTTLVTSDKNLGLLLPISGFKSVLGEPESTVTFDKAWPDLTELHWHGDRLTVFTERGKAMRITTSEPGAFLVLRPVDSTSQDSYPIKVGMTKAELFATIPEKASVMKDLARGGDVQAWNYFPALGMGVLIENGVVTAITVTPVKA